MIRKIITIDEEKCNGCGLCAEACHEGAIIMVDNKARLLSDEYCDGLGDCLPECPVDAIKLEEKDVKPFDKELVEQRMKQLAMEKQTLSNIPPLAAEKQTFSNIPPLANPVPILDSKLKQWPVQINLVNTRAPFLYGTDLLVAADCTAYAYADFHKEFIDGKTVLIGCPKLDDNEHYISKLSEMIKVNDFKSITVVRMEVPCCGGMTYAVKQAMLKAETIVPYSEITVTTDGKLIR